MFPSFGVTRPLIPVWMFGPLALIGGLGDALTTWYGLTYLGADELNPVMGALLAVSPLLAYGFCLLGVAPAVLFLYVRPRVLAFAGLFVLLLKLSAVVLNTVLIWMYS